MATDDRRGLSARVSGEFNRRPPKTLGWQSPHDLFANFRKLSV